MPVDRILVFLFISPGLFLSYGQVLPHLSPCKSEGIVSNVLCEGEVTASHLALLPNSTHILRIVGASFPELAQGTFSHFFQLQQLVIEDTVFGSIVPGAFDGLDSLLVLKLEHNAISNLPEGVFIGLSRLETLLLGDNGINMIETGTFQGLPNVNTLHLDSNNLKIIPCSTFNHKDLQSIKIIDISHNSISGMKGCEFQGLSSIDKLYLSHNKIPRLTSGTFEGMRMLRTLRLNNNQLSTLEEEAVSSLTRVVSLELQGNAFIEIPTGALRTMVDIQILILTGNPIGILQAGAFTGMTSLKELYLRRMYNLVDIQEGAFNGLMNLRILAIEDSWQLTSIPANLFIEPLPNLRYLYLSNNTIDYFAERTFEPLPSLVVLDINRNPLYCTCDLAWIAEDIQTRKYKFTAQWSDTWRTSRESPSCANPSALRGSPIIDVKAAQLGCQEPHTQKSLPKPIYASTGSTMIIQANISKGFAKTTWLSPSGYSIDGGERVTSGAKVIFEAKEERNRPDGSVIASLTIPSVSQNDSGLFTLTAINDNFTGHTILQYNLTVTQSTGSKQKYSAKDFAVGAVVILVVLGMTYCVVIYAKTRNRKQKSGEELTTRLIESRSQCDMTYKSIQ